jgi:hypothetical protein
VNENQKRDQELISQNNLEWMTGERNRLRDDLAAAQAEIERLREMRVSVPLSHAEVESLRPERLSAIGEMRGWNVGFPAGFAAGARAFAEWLWGHNVTINRHHGRERIVYACDEFLTSNSNNKEGK